MHFEPIIYLYIADRADARYIDKNGFGRSVALLGAARERDMSCTTFTFTFKETYVPSLRHANFTSQLYHADKLFRNHLEREV